MTSERKFIAENIRRVLLKEYLMRKTERAGFGDLDIQRTPLGTRVTLIAERPGMVIGRKGGTIKELTQIVEEEFKFDNPQIEVQEAPNPSLNPQIMAQKLVSALERGWHFRRAGHSTVRQIMSAGAKGCQVIISGKLTGQRHRVEKFKQGHIKFCGEPKKIWMLEGFAVAKKKLGIIGVKVQIMDPQAKLPDEVEILSSNDIENFIKTETEKIMAARQQEAVLEEQPAAAIEIKTEVEPAADDTADDGAEPKEKKVKRKKKTEKTEDDVSEPLKEPAEESKAEPQTEDAEKLPALVPAEEPSRAPESAELPPSPATEPVVEQDAAALEQEPETRPEPEPVKKPEEIAKPDPGAAEAVPVPEEKEPVKEEKSEEAIEKDGVDAQD